MPETQPTSSLTAEQPWRGAEPYSEEDRVYFHGRRREVEELRRLLLRDTITLLTGAAGTGKTSLVRAGLFPVLNGDWLPVLICLDWAAATDERPLSHQVLAAVDAATVSRKLEPPAKATPGETLWETFHRSGARWWNARQRVVTPVLVFDRFEEAFTVGTANATVRRHRDRFFDELSQLAANRPPPRVGMRLEEGTEREDTFDFGPVPLRILLVIREEAAPRLTSLRTLFPTLRRSELRLTGFTIEQARDALMRASAQRGLFADGVIDQLLRKLPTQDDADHPIPPKGLAVTAAQLAVERLRRKTDQITPDFLAAPGAERPAPVKPSTPPPLAPAKEIEAEPATTRGRASAPPRKSPVLALAALLAVAAGAYLWYIRNSEPTSGVTKSPPSESTPEPETPSTPEPAVAAPEPPPRVAIAPLPTPTPTPSSPLPAPPRPTATPPPPIVSEVPSPSPAVPAPSREPAESPSIAIATPVPLSATPTPKPPEDRDTAAAQSILERMRKRDAERPKTPLEPRKIEPPPSVEPEHSRKPGPPLANPGATPALPPRKTNFLPVGN